MRSRNQGAQGLAGLRVATWLFALATVTGCSAHNYLEAGPVFEGTPVVEGLDRDGLVVVSFNLKFGLEFETALAEFRADPKLSTADVYLLQEVDAPAAQFLAEGLGCHYVYYPISKHRKYGRDFGNAVLVRGEIHEHEKIVFPHEGWHSGGRRGATLAVVEVRGRRVEVASAHTEILVAPLSKRLDQVSALCREIGWRGLPAVVGGDFNVPLWGEGEALKKRFDRYGFSWESTEARDTADYLGWMEGTLDYVFARGLEEVRSGTSETAASDHRPVWVELAW